MEVTFVATDKMKNAFTHAVTRVSLTLNLPRHDVT